MTRSKPGLAPAPRKRKGNAVSEAPAFRMKEIQKWNTYLTVVRQTGPHWAR